MSELIILNKLHAWLNREADTFRGVAGVSLLDIATGRRLEVNGDEQFPTASTIKIHLLAALEELHHEGVINLDERVQVTPELSVPGTGVLTYLDDGVRLSWRDVANLMIITSDNTATNMVIDLLGFDRMAQFISSWGLENTVLQRKMQDHEAVAHGRENLATPNEEVRMMELMAGGDAFGPGVAEECLRILKKPKESYIKPGLPEDTVIASKYGAMGHVRCDIALVFQPRRPYVLSVMTKFGRYQPVDQEAWITGVAHEVHDVMSLLDTTSKWGQGIPPSYRVPRGDDTP